MSTINTATNPVNWLEVRADSARVIAMERCTEAWLFHSATMPCDNPVARDFVTEHTTYEGLMEGGTLVLLWYGAAPVNHVVSVGIIPPADAR
jgi:hypothetical protein